METRHLRRLVAASMKVGSWLARKGWRWLVAAILIFIVVRNVDVDRLRGVLSAIDVRWLLASVLAFGLSHVATVEALWRLSSALGLRVPRTGVGTIHFRALFLGSAVPGSIGTDVVKTAALGRRSGSVKRSAAAIAFHRGSALLLSLILLVAASPRAVALMTQRLPSFSLWSVVAAGLVFGVLTLVVGRTRRGKQLLATLRAAPREMFLVWRELVRANRLVDLLMVVALQALTLGLNVIGCYLAALTLGLDVGWLPFCALVPATYFAIAIPITVSGLGVREGVYATLLGLEGVPVTEAVALSVLVLLIGCIYLGVGGLLFITGRRVATGRRPTDPELGQ